jgi:hypothetical protein
MAPEPRRETARMEEVSAGQSEHVRVCGAGGPPSSSLTLFLSSSGWYR